MSRMDAERELTGGSAEKGWREVWTTGEFGGVIDTVKGVSPRDYLPAAMCSLTDLLNSRAFQVTLCVHFSPFLDFQQSLFPLVCDCADLSPLESFVSRSLQHPSSTVFLYGLMWLKDLLWSGTEESRGSFLSQAKTELFKAVSCARTSVEGKSQVYRYVHMLAASGKPEELESICEELIQRREFLAVAVLSEFARVTEASFQKLTFQLSQNSPAEHFFAVFKAIQHHSQFIFPQTLNSVSPLALSYVSKLWKSCQGRAVQQQCLSSLVAYVRIKALMPVAAEMRENEGKAAVAALVLIGSTVEAGVSPATWVEVCDMIAELKGFDAEILQKMVAVIAKIVAAGLKCDNGGIYLSLLRSLRAFIESADSIDISGLIPQSALPSVLSFLDSGTIDCPEQPEVAPLLSKYTVTEEPRRGLNWSEVTLAVSKLQQAVGVTNPLAVPANRSETVLKMEVVRALEDVKKLISA